MALDKSDHRLFVSTWTPPRPAVFDTNSGWRGRFSLLNKNLGSASHDAPASNVGVITGYAATFLLAI
jgi:hypothetical protein